VEETQRAQKDEGAEVLSGGAGFSPWPMDSPHWTGLVLKDHSLRGEPTLEQGTSVRRKQQQRRAVVD